MLVGEGGGGDCTIVDHYACGGGGGEGTVGEHYSCVLGGFMTVEFSKG